MLKLLGSIPFSGSCLAARHRSVAGCNKNNNVKEKTNSNTKFNNTIEIVLVPHLPTVRLGNKLKGIKKNNLIKTDTLTLQMQDKS